MDDMKIIYKDPASLIPYENNPRKNDQAVKYVAESIKQFGFKIPIIIDKDGVVVCGHTRLKSAKKLKLKEVPCIIAEDLTDEQIRAFRVADNKVAEKSEWDFDILDFEIESLPDFNFEDFGFEFEEEKDYKEATQKRVEGILNLEKAEFECVGKYDIPKLYAVRELPEIKEWIGFNYVLSDKNPEGKGVHFFIDDYQFIRVWNNPERYIDKLRQYACVLTPDFSPYADMPLATQIFNHYRKHWLGALWQQNGITVIPTIRASTDERSLEWYLDGEPKNGIVCISSMWTATDESKAYFLREFETMKKALKPKKIFVYGNELDELEGVEYIQSFCRKRFDNG